MDVDGVAMALVSVLVDPTSAFFEEQAVKSNVTASVLINRYFFLMRL